MATIADVGSSMVLYQVKAWIEGSFPRCENKSVANSREVIPSHEASVAGLRLTGMEDPPCPGSPVGIRDHQQSTLSHHVVVYSVNCSTYYRRFLARYCNERVPRDSKSRGQHPRNHYVNQQSLYQRCDWDDIMARRLSTARSYALQPCSAGIGGVRL